MSDFYEDMADTAAEMVEEFGRPVIIRRETPGQYFPGQGIMNEPVITDTPATGVFTQFSVHDIAASGGTILRTDKRAILTEPCQKNDLIIDGGTQYRVINTDTVEPGPIALIYKAQVRQ